MNCPHCLKAIHYQAASTTAASPGEEFSSDNGAAVRLGFCPACEEPIVHLERGHHVLSNNGYGTLKSVSTSELIFPRSSGRPPLPPEVDGVYRADYEESASVLPVSPKASAALSRRLLQHLLREKGGIKPGNLAQEIQSFVQGPGIPSHLAEAVDAVRQIGNLAAHPSKDQHTGEIVEVEPHEAEWLLEVLDALLDFTIVQPAKAKSRADVLAQKLSRLKKPAGKP